MGNSTGKELGMSYERDKLFSHIKVLSDTIWEGKASGPMVDAWLNNFENDNDSLQALYLLSRFTYFGDREFRESLKALYRDLIRYPIIKAIRVKNENTTDVDIIENAFDKELKKTLFLPIGSPSESGAHLLYYFRQENKLSTSQFRFAENLFEKIYIEEEPVTQLKDPGITRYIFIDDFCGSGKQAKKYSNEIVTTIKDLKPDSIVAYHVAFGTSAGIKAVRDLNTFDNVECLIELDGSFKCFSNITRYFNPNDELFNRDSSKDMALRNGIKLWQKHPLGFDDSQLMIGFPHNTPNNTLPIFWFEKAEIPWKAIFKRYGKSK